MPDMERYAFTFRDPNCPTVDYQMMMTKELAENDRDVRKRWGELVGPIVRVSIPLPDEMPEARP